MSLRRLVCKANQFGSDVSTDVRRAAAVAADYKALQGLGGVATGAGLALLALNQPVFGVVVIVGGLAASQAWYRQHFGRVRSRAELSSTVLLIVAALVVFSVGYRVDKIFGAPVLVFPIGAALYLALSYRFTYPHIGVTRAHWAVGVLLALCSLLPLLGVPAASAATADLLALAAAMVAVGVLDHLRLIAAMKPVPHD